MQRSFTVSTTTTTVPLDQGRGEAAFTVTNVSTQPVRGRGRVVVLPPTRETWLVVEGDAERDFQLNETQAYRVRIAVPAGSPADKYSFRLDMVSVVNPDEDFTEGPVVSFDYKPAVAARPFPMWVIPVAAVVLLAAALLAWHFFTATPSDKPVPAVTGLAYADAAAQLTTAGFKVEEKQQVEGKDPGTVLEQDPQANTVHPAGSVVTLTVEADLVAVPNIVGMKLPDAQAKLQDLGLLLVEQSHVLTTDSSKFNTVSKQDPEGGQGTSETRVHPGRPILVEVLEEGVNVPNLVGHSWDGDAPGLLGAAGLAPGAMTSKPPPPGTQGNVVLEENPAAGTVVARGTLVALVLSDKQVFVPNLVGRPLGEATNLLKSAGLNVGTVTKQPNGAFYLPGDVISQNPGAGAAAKPGDGVALVVHGVHYIIHSHVLLFEAGAGVDPKVIEMMKREQP